MDDAAVNRAYIGIASNDQAAQHIERGLAALRASFNGLRLSRVYSSADITNSDQRAYLNLAASFDTDLSWPALVDTLKAIETQCGRIRGAAVSGRVALDLDLLLLQVPGEVSAQHALPMSLLRTASHVLGPLCELLPMWEHPEGGESLARLWQRQRRTMAALTPVQFSPAATPAG